jgi:hypothetical protein
MQVLNNWRKIVVLANFVASHISDLVKPLQGDLGYSWVPGQEHDIMVVSFIDKSSGASGRT